MSGLEVTVTPAPFTIDLSVYFVEGVASCVAAATCVGGSDLGPQGARERALDELREHSSSGYGAARTWPRQTR